jgi:hypothetical protein
MRWFHLSKHQNQQSKSRPNQKSPIRNHTSNFPSRQIKNHTSHINNQNLAQIKNPQSEIKNQHLVPAGLNNENCQGPI